MANAKIISIIDHELERARAQTAGDIEVLRVESVHAIRDIGVLLINLRHDFNALAAAISQLRQDVDQLKQGGEGSA